MLAILENFSDLKVLQLQLIERTTYERTIVRCQYNFTLLKELMVFNTYLANSLSEKDIDPYYFFHNN